ncbi:tensin-2 isoform X4 [Eptesicus fuscus]|uniref:tensin-2 isoform X4 n=1 Tax=Eptesicus fuscus TaxID=29078 RepID=UPI0024047809|nr:tensin-2 isoform X4 [Eptesicus fuscus]
MGWPGGSPCCCCPAPPRPRPAGRPPQPRKAEPHSFREKVFRKKPPVCAVCKVTVEGTGVSCRVCKVATHRKCEAKVTSSCQALPPAELRRNTAPVRRIEHLGSTKSLNHSKQRSTLPRSFSLDPLMERRWDLDLTYVTERILAAAFPARPDEERHRSHLRELAHVLQSKHRDKYLFFNLSEKRHDLTRLNPKVQDFGWPELHAPPLDKLCSICKAMETWLSADPQHVVVLYCKGSKSKLGVIVSAYMHYSKISAGADQALATLTMRKFCEDKVAAELQPSQRRYINYFSGLLSGSIRMNSSPLFLHYVLVPVLPAFEAGTGFQPFLKIYQSMQLVYTSGIYHIAGPGPQQLCISLEPALLLKGDVMVTCYHKGGRGTDRTLVFRVQFHTCTIHGPRLTFPKDQLDEAWTDERFPFQASVEFIFSSGPEKIKGNTPRNDPSVTVDYNTAEPAVRWDSYENFNQHHEDSVEGSLTHTRGPLDGSPYAQVQRAPRQTPPAPSPELPPAPLLSVSSDSGHSSTLTTEPAAESPGRPPPTAAERQELDRLLGGCGVAGGGRGAGRETAILDDEEQPPASGGAHLGTKLSYEIPAEEGGDRYPLPGHLAPAGPLTSAESPEPASWREGPSRHSTLPRSPRDAPCSTSSEMSGPSTPLHTSSPVQGKESTRRQDTRSPTLAPTQRLSPGEALLPVSQGGAEKPPELPARSGLEPPAPSPLSPTSPRSSPNDWPQERSPGGRSDSGSPRGPVPTTLPGLRHAPWQGLREPPDSPDGSPLTPVPTQMPWLVASPEPPQSSPTPAFPVAASYDINGPTQPPLPEKRHLPGPGQQPGPWGPEQASPPARGTSHHVTFAPQLPDNTPQPPEPPLQESQSNVKFVQDTSKFWYKPHLSRDQAIALLKDKDPGAFLIRDSHSFQGAYGLALKVATPPPSAQPWKGDPSEQLVRHFLIETGPKGVKIKGCPSEPYFGSLSALVSQHSISPLSLPCCLRIPSKDPLEETPETPVPANMSTAADLLRQGAACSVLYLTSVETESLTGPQAVARASSAALGCSPRPTPAVVHFKVSAQGITLTDNQRKLFFRRHYPVNSITFSSTDPQDRRWTNPDGTTSKIFGFVAKKPGSPWENVCHLFAELDPDQPAGAIVTFITKVLLGQRK